MNRVKKRDYPVTTEIVNGLVITDHSAKFNQVPWSEKSNAERSSSVRINYLPGSRRLMQYSVGKISLYTEIVDGHPNGNAASSSEVKWDARTLPKVLPRIALGVHLEDEAWEYVHYSKNWPDGKTRFPKLTSRVAKRVESKGDARFQRVNASDMSICAQDLYGKKDATKPEVFTIHTLGLVGVGAVLEQFMELTAHELLLPHIQTIVSREPEIFT